MCKRVGSPLLFFVVTISIKSRLFELTRKKVDSVGTTRIFHLIILSTSSGSTLLFFVVTISIKSQLFLKIPSLSHEYRTISKERVDSLSRLAKRSTRGYYRGFSPNYFEYKLRVYPPLFCSNYFHKESTLFENPSPFS